MRTEIFLLILGMGLVTYLTRIGPFLLFQTTGMPAWLHRWLKPVPVAMLTALIVPGLLMPQGEMALSLDNHYLLAGIVTVFVALKSKQMLWPLGLGMITMLLLRW